MKECSAQPRKEWHQAMRWTCYSTYSFNTLRTFKTSLKQKERKRERERKKMSHLLDWVKKFSVASHLKNITNITFIFLRGNTIKLFFFFYSVLIINNTSSLYKTSQMTMTNIQENNE